MMSVGGRTEEAAGEGMQLPDWPEQVVRSVMRGVSAADLAAGDKRICALSPAYCLIRQVWYKYSRVFSTPNVT